MSFNYNHEKNKHQENFWTSYADLYTTLFTIFLFIYVGSTLKQGSKTFEQQQDKQMLKKQIVDLQQQLKVYEALKDDYMKKEAQPEDVKLYDELMGKLDLLQDEAKTEKEKLRQQAMENELKEKALNKYQQLIRNMINSNVLAKTKIQKRNEIIDQKENIITEQDQNINQMQDNLEAQRNELANKEHKINMAKDELNNQVKKLEAAYRTQQISKKEMEQKIKNLQVNAQNEIALIKNQADIIKNQLEGTQAKLANTNQALDNANKEKSNLMGELALANKGKAELEGEIGNLKGKYENELGTLKGKFENELAGAKKGFAEALAKEKLSGAERAKKEAGFRQAMAEKEKDYQEKLNNLKGKFDKTQGDLKDALDKINTKKRLADQIRKNFARNGINVEVDEKTGEVVLDFKNSYFDTGRAELKKEMIATLQKFIPIYSEGLFQDTETAGKIASIEIIGFASPTFKGKLVDPSSLDPSNRSAVNYNLDLSYNRAKSIFSYIFDTNKMKYNNQQRLLSMVKVTGRSFLANKSMMGGSSENSENFCNIHDCKKEQKVIIKFNLKD